MTKTAISLADIEAKVAVDTPVDFEPDDASGNPSGIVLEVLSDQSPIVQERLRKLIQGQRKKDALLAVQQEKSRPGEVLADVAEQADYGRKLVAARLHGWKGVAEEFNEANAVKLLKLIPHFGPLILRKAEELGGFTVASPTA